MAKLVPAQHLFALFHARGQRNKGPSEWITAKWAAENNRTRAAVQLPPSPQSKANFLPRQQTSLFPASHNWLCTDAICTLPRDRAMQSRSVSSGCRRKSVVAVDRAYYRGLVTAPAGVWRERGGSCQAISPCREGCAVHVAISIAGRVSARAGYEREGGQGCTQSTRRGARPGHAWVGGAVAAVGARERAGASEKVGGQSWRRTGSYAVGCANA